MDGDARYKNLLKFAMTKKSTKDVTVILIIDMSRPWTIMDTLNSWVHVLREHIHSLNLSPKELNEMEHNSESAIKELKLISIQYNLSRHFLLKCVLSQPYPT